MSSFEEFTEKRRLLQEFCSRHYRSIEIFSNGGLSYKRNPDESDVTPSAIRHITSTVTCYSSLLQCPARFKPLGHAEMPARATRYADGAIQLPRDKWTSDGSAPTYCRCRALPFIVKHTSKWSETIGEYIGDIFVQMDNPERLAIGEAEGAADKWYPPNAYHTYWTLCVLEEVRQRFGSEYATLVEALKLNARILQLREWARKTLAYQISLHSASSSVLDSDQLGWSLADLLPEN